MLDDASRGERANANAKAFSLSVAVYTDEYIICEACIYVCCHVGKHYILGNYSTLGDWYIPVHTLIATGAAAVDPVVELAATAPVTHQKIFLRE